MSLVSHGSLSARKSVTDEVAPGHAVIRLVCTDVDVIE
jgi:hypothetical protein